MIITVIVAVAGVWISRIIFPSGRLATSGWASWGNKATLSSLMLSLLGVNCGWAGDGDSMSINGPTWYLSVLMICYTIFYYIMRLWKNNQEEKDGAFVLLVLFGVFICTNNVISFPLLFQSCGRAYAGFFTGVLLARITEGINTERRRLISLVGAVLAIDLFLFALHYGLVGNAGISATLLFSPALIIIMMKSNIMRWISDNKVVSYLGKISFEIFLWDIPVAIWFYLLEDIFDWSPDYGSRKFFLLTVLVTVAVSVLAHEFLEKPIRRRLLKKWIASR